MKLSVLLLVFVVGAFGSDEATVDPTRYPTDEELNCEQYYDGTSKCEIRRAWLRDWVSWRIDTLHKWADDFAKLR